MPLIDLHAHYPMHTRFPPRLSQGPPPVGKELEFWAANQLLNFQGGKPRVSLDQLLAGADGGIGSVLYDPDDEFFRSATPRPEAFANLIAQMDNVEQEIAGKVLLARNPAEVRQHLAEDRRFLFHVVEGAFALGGQPANVDVLAKRGVAYLIIAHLFFRGVATCSNAFPFVPDFVFETLLNPGQDPDVGLTPLGMEIVNRTLQQGIIVDITHSTPRAQEDIFRIAHDFGNRPVISSHNGVQGTSDFPLNLSDDAIRRIADSKGIIGIILAPYWLRQPIDQLLGATDISLVFAAIDHIHRVTGSYDVVAIGSDLDGFIHPITGCEDFAHTPSVVAAIRKRYPGVAERILWQNVVEVLERGWTGVPSAGAEGAQPDA